jgi:hypothetical protein
MGASNITPSTSFHPRSLIKIILKALNSFNEKMEHELKRVSNAQIIANHQETPFTNTSYMVKAVKAI